jgi:hypothetical protein
MIRLLFRHPLLGELLFWLGLIALARVIGG